MLKMLTALTLLWAIAVAADSFASEDARECLRVNKEGEKTTYENTCSYEVIIAYCSTNTKISSASGGKLCGENGSERNPYYTHVTRLEAGKKDSWDRRGDVRYAVCSSTYSEWYSDKAEKFSSDLSGAYVCPKSKAVANSNMGNSTCSDGRKIDFDITVTNQKYFKIKAKNGKTITLSGAPATTAQKMAETLCEGSPVPGDWVTIFAGQMKSALSKAADSFCKGKKEDPQCLQQAQKYIALAIRD